MDNLVRISLDFSPDSGMHWYPLFRDMPNAPPYSWLPDTTLAHCKEKGYIPDINNLDLRNAQLKFTAKDLAGNDSSSTIQFFVDGQPPSGQWEYPKNKDTLFSGTCDTLRLKNISDNFTKEIKNIKIDFDYSLGETTHWQSIPDQNDTCFKQINDTTWTWTVPKSDTTISCFIRATLIDSVGNDSSIIDSAIIRGSWDGVKKITPSSNTCVRWQNMASDTIKIVFREKAFPASSWGESISLENIYSYMPVDIVIQNNEGDTLNQTKQSASALALVTNVANVALYKISIGNYYRSRDAAKGINTESVFFNLLEPQTKGTINFKRARMSSNSIQLNIENNPLTSPAKIDFLNGTMVGPSYVSFLDSTYWKISFFLGNSGEKFNSLDELDPFPFSHFQLKIFSNKINRSSTLKMFYRGQSGSWTPLISSRTGGNYVFINMEGSDKLKNEYAIGNNKFQIKVVNFPNPFNPNSNSTKIYIDTDEKVRSLKIYDPFGNLVRILQVQDKYAVWDGTNDNGMLVGNGGYICVVTTMNGKKYYRKILILKNTR